MHRSSIVNLFSGAGDGVRDEEIDPLHQQTGGTGEMDEQAQETIVVQLSPRHHEQAAILSFAMDMRNESSFCDISFVVNGSIFRAHRVIVRYELCVLVVLSFLLTHPFYLSAWSRWLRALLCEGDDEIVALELFAADAFGAVLDYMYGQPIHFSTEVALLSFSIRIHIY